MTAFTSGLSLAITRHRDAEKELPNKITGFLLRSFAQRIAARISFSELK